MTKRESNNPKRRIVATHALSDGDRLALIGRSAYVGSALHKRTPADYGFHPPINPRPSKSLCDDLRAIPHAEASRLLQEGLRKGLVSPIASADDLPKYVWCVDADGEVYEAKLGNDGYHGYRLDRNDERDMRELVVKEWRQR